ncbi:MAG TPA: N-6 DNA methylase [Thermoanaerobaculia bacterium]|nr:N-6 DNA methylase [Thermoanaerobaculia bacterium]
MKPTSQSALALQPFETALGEALFAQLQRDSSRLGISMRAARIEELSCRLLGLTRLKGLDFEARPSLAGIETASGGESDFEPHDYLHLVPQEIRRSLGQYMTPRPIARYILQAAGYRPTKDLLARTLCDPACGSGVFMVEAIRTYLTSLREARVPTEEWYPKVREHFVGIDVDPIACLYARFNLSVLLASAVLSWMRANPRRLPDPLPIHEGDTLSSLAVELGETALLDPRTPEIRFGGAFDFVVGNPPYRKLARIPLELRRAFADSIYGHPNAYGMFLHAGIEMLRPGGRLGFIVPRSMLSGLYFQNLRRMIEERTCLQEVSLFADRKRVFSRVLQGTMILVFRKRGCGEGENRQVRTAIIRSNSELENGGPLHVSPKASQVARRLNGTTVWFVSDQERTYSLLDKIVDRHPLLGGPAVGCPAKTGPIVWNRVKPFLRKGGGKGTLPLVWATDVGRFRFSFGAAGESRPAFLAETHETERLATYGPSLLVQRVTADEQARRIVAGLARLPDRKYFVENHLNVLQVSSKALVDLRFLLGLLSSDVVEFLFRSMNGNTQVSATELNLLPIPRGRFESEIIETVELLEDAAAEARDGLEQDLNERVARAYGINGSDLRFLRKTLSGEILSDN